MELNLPSEWNVVILSQEIRGASTSYHLEGFLRVSSDFEGSVQAVLAENPGLSIIAFAKRAGYNNVPSVFIPFHSGWSRFSVDLPCSDPGVTVLKLLIEGRGRIWLDDLELRPRL